MKTFNLAHVIAIIALDLLTVSLTVLVLADCSKTAEDINGDTTVTQYLIDDYIKMDTLKLSFISESRAFSLYGGESLFGSDVLALRK